MLLSRYTQGKDNNFNLIRLLAAASVLFGHSFALLKQPEPLAAWLGMSIGSIAVDVFFVSSGFLVGASLLTKKQARSYLLARALRIYPALIVMSLLSVLVLGTYFTTLPLAQYFGQKEIYTFFIKCATVLGGVAFHLPGVFADNPFPDAVNGSLWSMVYEVKMYLLLLLLWLVCRRKQPGDVNHVNAQPTFHLGWMQPAIIALVVISGTLLIGRKLGGLDESRVVRFIFLFFSGTLYWMLRERIQLRGHYALVAALALVLAAVGNTLAFFIVYQLTLAYLLLYLAFVPAGSIRRFNRLGDYSYGVYIYAFPVQQSLIALFPQISVFSLFLAAMSVTLCLAVLSWHLLEKRALKFKNSAQRMPN